MGDPETVNQVSNVTFIESETLIAGVLHGEGLDFVSIFYFLFFQDNIESVEIIRSVGTDHSCLLMKLRPTYQNARGRSFWKFNNSLTQVEHFVNFLKSKIPLFETKASFEDQTSKWVFIEYKCREVYRTIQFRNQNKEGLCMLNWKRNLQTLNNYSEQTAPKIFVRNTIFANQNLTNYTILSLLD